MENQLIEFLEENTELIHIDFIEKDQAGYTFAAYSQEEMEEVEIFISVTNAVFVKFDHECIHLNSLYLPFNVWSA
jgi:hypothetical protein